MSKFNVRAFFGAGCIILMILSVLIYVRRDHTAPVIQFSAAELVYQEGEDTADLLTNLRAEDNRDGDLTDKVFVVSVTPNNDQTKAVVLYGVEDKAHNATVKARTVTYQATGASPVASDANATDGTATDSAQDSNLNSDTEASSDQSTNTDQQSDAVAGTGAVQSENTNAAAPVVTLSSSQEEIQAGSRFNPVSVITSITDDKDDQNALFRRVSISGDYNVNKVGTYPIQIIVTDSDGNTSAPVSFNLVVK